MPWVNDYLEFLEGRCRPNTVLAAAYDLRVFFGVVGKAPANVVAADVLGFITAQRTGRRDWQSPESVETWVCWIPLPVAAGGRRPELGSGLAGGHPEGVALIPARSAARSAREMEAVVLG